MLIALVGITGVGKTYLKNRISEELGFKNVNTIRTRKKREGENFQKTGFFMTEKEMDELENQGKLAYRFKVFGGDYAYLRDEIFSDDNRIFEMHYTTIYDWKKINPDIKTIYILPNDIEIAKNKTRERHLEPEKEKERLDEMEEHYNRIMTDEKLREQFDYIVYNNYDENSEKEIINLVKKIMNQ